LVLADNDTITNDLVVLGTEISSVDETWEQPWGEKRLIRNHCQGFKVTLGSVEGGEPTLQLEFRAYNDGIAFRYLIPDQEGLPQLHVMDELTEFAFPADHKA
jgi:alpha-glucosidase